MNNMNREKTITSKKDVQPALQRLFEKKHRATLAIEVHDELLTKKIKFPVLEFCAHTLSEYVPEGKQIDFLNKISAYRTIGGNVLIGIMLQNRLKKFFSQSMRKAIEYMMHGDEWYVCDIIGERVMGHALLTMPEKTLIVLKKHAKHKNTWVVRSIGVAGHYAIKNGLKKKYVEELFSLLLSLSSETEFHTKTGIGWAAKTTAKFHPDIIRKFEKRLKHPEIKTWFHTKINIGLSRNYKYASRYTD